MKKRIERFFGQLRKDRKTLRGLAGKKKLQFIWDYYKIPLLAVLFVLVLGALAFLIRTPKKNIALYIVWINAVPAEESSYFDDLLHGIGEEYSEKTADVNTAYTLGVPGNEASDAQTMQLLSALFGIGDMDIFIADPQHFEQYAGKGAFTDLTEALPEDLRNAAEERLLYSLTEKGESVASGYRLTDSSCAAEAGYLLPGSEAVLGVLGNAQNKDTAVKLLEELIRSDYE